MGFEKKPLPSDGQNDVTMMGRSMPLSRLCDKYRAVATGCLAELSINIRNNAGKAALALFKLT